MEKLEILSHKKKENISWNQVFSNFLRKTVTFTKFLPKKCENCRISVETPKNISHWKIISWNQLLETSLVKLLLWRNLCQKNAREFPKEGKHLKNEKFYTIWIWRIIRQINYFVKTLISRNFCSKAVWYKNVDSTCTLRLLRFFFREKTFWITNHSPTALQIDLTKKNTWKWFYHSTILQLWVHTI